MKITEFINGFKDKKIQNTQITPNAVTDYLKKTLEIKEYIPFIEKRELCAGVIEGSCHNKNGIVEVDSVSRYFLFTVAMVMKYTNLEFNSDENVDSFAEYDLLCSMGLLDEILGVIGEEYIKCNNLLNMMVNDIVSNNNTTEAVIALFLDGIQDKLSDLTDVLVNKIDEMNFDLSQIDIDKVMPLLEKLGGRE